MSEIKKILEEQLEREKASAKKSAYGITGTFCSKRRKKEHFDL